jgi:type II secretory pathway component HofQ
MELAKDIDEVDTGTPPVIVPAEPEMVSAPVTSPAATIDKKLERIQRVPFQNKDRLQFFTSEAIEYEKKVLDKKIVLELKGVKPSEMILPLQVEEPDSFIRQVTVSSTAAPFPSTQVTIHLTDSVNAQVTQQANEISVDFEKKKIARYLKEGTDQTVELGHSDFGGYLASPTSLPGQEVSLHTTGAYVTDILRMLAETGNYNLIVKPYSKRISVRLEHVPWDKAFVSILESNQLGYVKQNNILRVSTLKARDSLQPLQTLFIPLQFRDASEIKPHLYPFLSERGSITVDYPANTLIVKDIPAVLKRSEKMVSQLDIQ